MDRTSVIVGFLLGVSFSYVVWTFLQVRNPKQKNLKSFYNEVLKGTYYVREYDDLTPFLRDKFLESQAYKDYLQGITINKIKENCSRTGGYLLP